MKNKYDFWEWFDTNLIYCENTHSFVHRLCMKLNIENHREAQNKAFEVIKEMKDYFNSDEYNKR